MASSENVGVTQTGRSMNQLCQNLMPGCSSAHIAIASAPAIQAMSQTG